jgi:protocatechuate 3,4-dioxygenase beta subunit
VELRLTALAACTLTVTVALLLAAEASGSAAAPACQPTPSDVAGPFQTSGAASPRRSRIGKGHVLVVRVLRSPDCAPVDGAFVQLWQASPGGRYDRRGRGSVVTGSSGAFRFVGPVPPSYEGRSPHIHIVVSAPGYEELLTRYEVPPGRRSGRITLILRSFL